MGRNDTKAATKPRRLPKTLEGRCTAGKGPLWATERSLREAFIRNEHQPWEVVNTVHDWIMSQKDPLRVCDLLGVVVLDWVLSPDIDERNRRTAETISERIEHWRRTILATYSISKTDTTSASLLEKSGVRT